MEDFVYASKLHEAETRKVQLTGGATLIVSLPKEWTRQVNLKPGDEVLILPQPDKSLLIVPKRTLKTPHLEVTVKLNGDILRDPSKLERLLISYYLSGVDLLRIELEEDVSEARRIIKKIIREKLAGMEIIEESREQLVLQNLVSLSDTDINSLLLKMLKTVTNMLSDLRLAIEKGDVLILLDLVERDAEVDRFYWFIRRLLKKMLASGLLMILTSIKDPRSVIEYSTIGKMLERIADNISEIAVELTTKVKDKLNQIPNEIRSQIVEILRKQQMQLESLMEYLSSKKLTLENLNGIIETSRRDIISKIENMLSIIYTTDFDRQLATTFRMIMYNLLRISEYTIDVAEAFLDLMVDSMVSVRH